MVSEYIMIPSKDIIMREHGKMTLQMAKVNKSSLMVLIMKEIFLMGYVMEREDMFQIQEFMKVILLMASFMGRELLLILIIENMLAAGKTV